MPGHLLASAERLRDAHQRLATAVLASSGVLVALEEERVVLNELLAEIRSREEAIDGVQSLIADRVNNLLMSIKTASNLLRKGTGDVTPMDVSQQLDASVEGGRTSLRTMRDAVARLR
jgi:hypothetical protein